MSLTLSFPSFLLICRNPLYQFDFIYNLTPAGMNFKRNSSIVARKADEIIRKRKKNLSEQVYQTWNSIKLTWFSTMHFFANWPINWIAGVIVGLSRYRPNECVNCINWLFAFHLLHSCFSAREGKNKKARSFRLPWRLAGGKGTSPVFVAFCLFHFENLEFTTPCLSL